MNPSGQTVPTADDSIAIFTSASYGTYKVYCQAQGVSGPAGLDSIIVVVGKVPQLTYPLNQTICKGSCVNLNCSTSGAQGGNLLVWYLSNEGGTIEAATYGTSPFSLPYNACPNFTTNYWATAYDTSTGCSDLEKAERKSACSGFGAGRAAGRRRCSSRKVRRAPDFSGRNPRKWKFSVGSPEAMSAVTAAFAPGMGMTGTPAAMASRTSQLPGSLMAGVPASLTSAMALPAFRSWMSSVERVDSLCWWQLTVFFSISK